MNVDRQLDMRERRRLAAEHRALGRAERLEAAALPMIGELNGGRHYIWPVGGRYREGSVFDLISFLIRNRYVS